VSFRLTLDKPHFRDLHYHHYLSSHLRKGPLRAFAALPANLSWKWLATRVRFLGRKLGLGGAKRPEAAGILDGADPESREVVLPAAEIPVGGLLALSPRVCATRLEDGRVLAFARLCPHQGADLTRGYVADATLVCPWHNLKFDLASGESPCKALRALRQYPVAMDGDRVRVSLAHGHVDEG
jgi:nitrite reductase/ring-hydroxylating ferredoxin subunit